MMCASPLLLDTGASVSLLNVATYSQLFSSLPLSGPLRLWCSKIHLVGSLLVHYGTKTLPGFGFHVAHREVDLMGLDLFFALGFSLVDIGGGGSKSGHHCLKVYAVVHGSTDVIHNEQLNSFHSPS